MSDMPEPIDIMMILFHCKLAPTCSKKKEELNKKIKLPFYHYLCTSILCIYKVDVISLLLSCIAWHSNVQYCIGPKQLNFQINFICFFIGVIFSFSYEFYSIFKMDQSENGRQDYFYLKKKFGYKTK